MNIDKLIGGVLLIWGLYSLKSWYKEMSQIEQASPFIHRAFFGGLYLVLAGIALLLGLGNFSNK